MANMHPQRQDKVATVKANATRANGVSGLADEVVRLAEAVGELQDVVRRPEGSTVR